MATNGCHLEQHRLRPEEYKNMNHTYCNSGRGRLVIFVSFVLPYILFWSLINFSGLDFSFFGGITVRGACLELGAGLDLHITVLCIG